MGDKRLSLADLNKQFESATIEGDFELEIKTSRGDI